MVLVFDDLHMSRLYNKIYDISQILLLQYTQLWTLVSANCFASTDTNRLAILKPQQAVRPSSEINTKHTDFIPNNV